MERQLNLTTNSKKLLLKSAGLSSKDYVNDVIALYGSRFGKKNETIEKNLFAYLLKEENKKRQKRNDAVEVKALIKKYEKPKKIIKVKNVIEITQNNDLRMEALYKIIKNNVGKPFQIQILSQENVSAPFKLEKEQLFNQETITELYTNIKLFVMEDSSCYIWDKMNVRIFIIFGETPVKTNKIIQSFFEGSINCVMLPILNFINEKIKESKTTKTTEKYNTLLKKSLALEEKFHDIGVNNKALDEISNILQIDIHINLPFQKDFIVSKSNKKALRIFHFINTKLNHVEFDELTHNEKEEILTLDELKLKQKELDISKTFYTYTKSKTNINSISTSTTLYKLKDKFRNCVYNFEINARLLHCKLDDITQSELSSFVRQGCHFNETVDVNSYVDKYNHIDMKKAYINYKQSKYYEGFVGKITDFRECNHIVGIGYYQIKDLVLNGKIKEMNEYLNCYNDNVYFSSELKMLKDEGSTFNIVCGCWGEEIDLDFFPSNGTSIEEQRINYFKNQMLNDKDEGNRYYCKYIGQMFSRNLEKSYYIKTDDEFLKHLVNEVEADIDVYNKEVRVSYKKQHSHHLSHICGGILAHMRINMLEQLKEFKKEEIIKIVVDGIFHTKKDVVLKNVFVNEPKEITLNSPSHSYFSNDKCLTTFKVGTFKKYEQVECHIGVGGGGKTHNNLIDEGLVGLCYFAPSWKLARNKQKEYGCHVDTIAKLITKDPICISNLKKWYNVFIIDEISMMSEEEKQYIMETYNDCKLIFCGDPNYQLPAIEGTPFSLKDMKVIEYNTNYRVKCDKLANLLSEVRRFIKGGINPRELIEDACLKGNVDDYDYLKDLIICSTHKNKDVFTEKFKHLNKYYILKSDRIYGRGEIHYDLPNTEQYEIRHAYTVHSIQGETATGKLYIDFAMYNPKMLYTAISRAQYLNQIVLV